MRVSQKSHKLPAEGEHTATLLEYEDLGLQPDKFNIGKEKQQVKLTFTLNGGEKQFYWCNVSLHPDSHLFRVASALFGINPPPEIELDDLVGRACTVSIKHYQSAKGTRAKITEFAVLREKNVHEVEISNADCPF
jgi:hypothetical protein